MDVQLQALACLGLCLCVLPVAHYIHLGAGGGDRAGARRFAGTCLSVTLCGGRLFDTPYPQGPQGTCARPALNLSTFQVAGLAQGEGHRDGNPCQWRDPAMARACQGCGRHVAEHLLFL